MTEPVKTLIFVGIAAFVLAGAILSRPTYEEFDDEAATVNQVMFPQLENPDDAASLEITRYDDQLGEFSRFKVAIGADNQWVIPSHNNYPADAEDQMKDVAGSLVDLKILHLVSRLKKDHELFGVVEPDQETIEAADEGVGTLVVVQDASGNNLAQLIVGKKRKDEEGQYYVRKRGSEDAIYVVEIDPEKLSTKFEDWIEDDLLKLNAWDISTVALEDYSIVQTLQAGRLRFEVTRRHDIAVRWDSTNSSWDLDKMISYAGVDPVETKLADIEELNKSKLNDMKSALDDLKIVDIRRKPAGFGADLRAGDDFLEDNEAVQDLFQRGFIPARTEEGGVDLRAVNGEVTIGMEDGVQYQLRFGEIVGAGDDEGNLNRYLFVTAQLDMSKIPAPELEPVPELPAGPEAETVEGNSGQDEASSGQAEEDEATEETEASEDASESVEETSIEDDADAAEIDAEEVKSELERERERITKENQRKQEEYDEKVKVAANKVADLNARFADWYYVIAEDVYKKIHLSRGDLIQESEEAKKEGFGVDALRKLEDEGIEGAPEPPPAAPAPGGFPGAGGFPQGGF
ncbi:MAG: DUF4340 domain-containing protein [Pirellulaceae bacterium]|nr:DUF4340 domain-containing protein [Pirellulaceae bacterium]